MKKLLFLTAIVPGGAFAHGVHAPVPEASHGLVHAAPVIGLAVIVIAGGLALRQRYLS